MRKAKTYEFDDTEIHIIAQALAMYAAYNKHCIIPMLIGDESDAKKIHKETSRSMAMARNFIEEDRGERWEELSRRFHTIEDRPMDMSDVSEFDWFEYMQGERNR